MCCDETEHSRGEEMTTQATVAAERPRALAAITSGGLIAGSFDLTFALVFNGLRGVRLIRIPQSIASGLLGCGRLAGEFLPQLWELSCIT